MRGLGAASWIVVVIGAVSLAGGCGSEEGPTGPLPPAAPPQLCEPSGETEASCENGVDDDCDGTLDCADDDCVDQACGTNGLTCQEGACTLDGVLTTLPPLDGLKIDQRGDGAVFSFVPHGEAKDYRIWVLPDPAGISEAEDGSVVVTDAYYRCAGDRPLIEAEGTLTAELFGYARTEEESLLGHAFVVGAPGRKPVFALGEPNAGSDERTGTPFSSSRNVVYTAELKTRNRLLQEGYRDDGIVFYVPETGGDRPIFSYESAPQPVEQDKIYYLTLAGGAEEEAISGGEGSTTTPIADLLSEPTDGTLPVHRVTVGAHDLLALGDGLRDRYLREGNQPLNHVTWKGLTEKTTLVIEALDRGCAFGGLYASSDTEEIGYAKPFISLARAQEESETGEVWVNGQHEDTGTPVPLARSFVTLEPQAAPQMDFYADFSTTGIAQEYEETERDEGAKRLRFSSDLFDLEFWSIELDSWSVGEALGNLWVAYADWAADTNGKFRLTAKQMAELDEDNYLHVTAEFDIPSTHRRYPQILISDQPPPVQAGLVNGATIIVQPFSSTTEVQIQLCKERTWDVNNQCPRFKLGRSLDFEPAYSDNETLWPPRPVPGEWSGFDLPVLFDVYVSQKRVYLFFNHEPFGCAKIPDGTWNPGPVSVTLGDVLYHSGVDEDVICDECAHQFLRNYQLPQTVRRFDNFGFQNGVKEPKWNESIFPCTEEMN